MSAAPSAEVLERLRQLCAIAEGRCCERGALRSLPGIQREPGPGARGPVNPGQRGSRAASVERGGARKL
jgi:hypothetical protein